MTVPWGFNPFGPAKSAWVFIVGATLTAWALRSGTTTPVARSPITRWATWALAALGFAGVFVSMDPRGSILGSYPEFLGLAGMASLGVAAAAFVALAGEDRAARSAVLAVCVGALVLGLIGLSEKTGLIEWGFRAALDESRVHATAGNPSNLGVVLAGALGVAVALVPAESGRRFILAASVLAVGIPVLVWTESRGALVGLAAALTLAVVLGVREKGARRSRSLVAVALAVALAGGTLVLSPDAMARVGGTDAVASSSASWRIDAWSSGLRAALDRPLLGWGLSTGDLVLPAYLPGAAADNVASSHNLIIDVALWAGIPAAIALAALLGTALVAGVRSSEISERALATGLLAALLALQFHPLSLDGLALIALLVAPLAARAREMGGAPRRNEVAVAGVVIAALAVCAVFASLGVIADARVASAYEAASDGDWARASSQFESAGDAVPRESWPLLAHADAALQVSAATGSEAVADEGIAAYEAALAAGRQTAATRLVGAKLYAARWAVTENRADLEEAISLLEVAVANDVSDAEAWRGLAELYKAAGRSEDSAEAASKASEAVTR